MYRHHPGLLRQRHLHQVAVKKTIYLTNAQYTWYASLRNTVAITLGMTSPMYHRMGMLRLIGIDIAIFGVFVLADELFVRIDGQSPRRYYRAHDMLMSDKLYTAVFAVMAAILFVTTWLLR